MSALNAAATRRGPMTATITLMGRGKLTVHLGWVGPGFAAEAIVRQLSKHITHEFRVYLDLDPESLRMTGTGRVETLDRRVVGQVKLRANAQMDRRTA